MEDLVTGLSPVTMLWVGPRKPLGKRRAFLHHQCSLSLSGLGKAIVKAHFLEAFLFGVNVVTVVAQFFLNNGECYHSFRSNISCYHSHEPSPTPPKLYLPFSRFTRGLLTTKEDMSKTHHLPFTTIFKPLTNEGHHVFLLDQVLKLKKINKYKVGKFNANKEL